jgi:hypothetical protein
MGRIVSAVDYAEDGVTAIRQRSEVVYYDGTTQLHSDRVTTREGVAAGAADKGATQSYYSYDLLDQLVRINGDTYATSSATTPNGSHETTYSYTWRDAALQGTTVFKPQVLDSGTYSTATTSYDANGFVSQVSTSGQNARTIGYVTDVSGQVLQRSQGLGVSAPRVVSSYLSGMKLGEIGNDGTDNTDFASAVNAQATARGTGAFRGGASSATAYADPSTALRTGFDQSYASVTPGSMAPVAGSITAQGGDSFASLATRLWGDASLWYLLAEANPGLATGPSASLLAGKALTVPNKVSKNSGDTDTNSGNTIRIPPQTTRTISP